MTQGTHYGKREEDELSTELPAAAPDTIIDPQTAAATLAAKLLATVRELDKHIGKRAEEYAAPLIDQATEWAAEKVRTANNQAQATRDVNASLSRLITTLERQNRELKRQLEAAKRERQ